MAARIPSHMWDFSQKKPVERALFFLLGSPKIFNFWGERRHWVLSTRQASSVRFNCRTRSWPTWNRTKIFRTKIWRNSLYTIGHRQNKCCFFSKAGAKVLLFFELTKLFADFFSKKCNFLCKISYYVLNLRTLDSHYLPKTRCPPCRRMLRIYPKWA